MKTCKSSTRVRRIFFIFFSLVTRAPLLPCPPYPPAMAMLLPSATVTIQLPSAPKISATIHPDIRSVTIPSRFPSSRSSLRIGSVRCRALGEGSQQRPLDDDRTVYQGVYGPWTVDPSDVREVPLPIALLVSFGILHEFSL